MRDLKEHPITTGEIIAELERVAFEVEMEARVGGMRALLLRTAATMIRRVEFVTDGIEAGLTRKDAGHADRR